MIAPGILNTMVLRDCISDIYRMRSFFVCHDNIWQTIQMRYKCVFRIQSTTAWTILLFLDGFQESLLIWVCYSIFNFPKSPAVATVMLVKCNKDHFIVVYASNIVAPLCGNGYNIGRRHFFRSIFWQTIAYKPKFGRLCAWVYWLPDWLNE